MLELGDDPDRAGAARAELVAQVDDLLEGRDLVAAVVERVALADVGQPLLGAQRLQLGEREVLGEPAVRRCRRRSPSSSGGRRTRDGRRRRWSRRSRARGAPPARGPSSRRGRARCSRRPCARRAGRSRPCARADSRPRRGGRRSSSCRRHAGRRRGRMRRRRPHAGDTPTIYGHRGAAGYRPEHTLALLPARRAHGRRLHRARPRLDEGPSCSSRATSRRSARPPTSPTIRSSPTAARRR